MVVVGGDGGDDGGGGGGGGGLVTRNGNLIPRVFCGALFVMAIMEVIVVMVAIVANKTIIFLMIVQIVQRDNARQVAFVKFQLAAPTNPCIA